MTKMINYKFTLDEAKKRLRKLSKGYHGKGKLVKILIFIQISPSLRKKLNKMTKMINYKFILYVIYVFKRIVFYYSFSLFFFTNSTEVAYLELTRFT